MALADFVYRLKPQSGDTTPHDELGTAGDLTGGTITLVDLGTSDYAWQFAGKAEAAGPSKTMTNDTVGTGWTIACRIAVTSYDASSFAFLLGWVIDSALSRGLALGQNGTNNLRVRYIDTSSDTIALGALGTTVHTIVMRVSIASGTTDKVHVWVEGVGSSDTADFITPGGNYATTGDQVLDTILCGSSGSTIRVADFVIWNEELSGADCNTLRTSGIRATLDAGGGGPSIKRALINMNGGFATMSGGFQ